MLGECTSWTWEWKGWTAVLSAWELNSLPLLILFRAGLGLPIQDTWSTWLNEGNSRHGFFRSHCVLVVKGRTRHCVLLCGQHESSHYRLPAVWLVPRLCCRRVSQVLGNLRSGPILSSRSVRNWRGVCRKTPLQSLTDLEEKKSLITG